LDQGTLNIICVLKTPDLAHRLHRIFPKQKVRVALEKSIDKVIERFEQEEYDVLILSSAAPSVGGQDSLELLELISAKCPSTQILFLAETSRLGMAMSALKAGSFHYAKLPIPDQELRLLIETALEQRLEYAPNLLLKEEVHKTKFEQMVGGSTTMRQVYRQIRQAAATEIPVYLSGETGTGKDLAAQAIHQLSSRQDKPYLPVHLGALPQELVASELFGHEKGAFTGATDSYRGSFEQANGGTVFLDEISTISEKVQISLLRLLEAKEFYRIGGRRPVRSDVRVIAASNEDLLSAVERGRFREDLYYRLEVLQIHMPPLRERHGDMLLLMEHFINTYCRTNVKNIQGVSPECLSLMSSYDWPGNVRELKNVILRAVVQCQGDIILPEHLTDRIRYGHPKVPMISMPVGQTLEAMEREMIVRTLEYTGHNKKLTAEILGISRRALYNKIKKQAIPA
jgi:DNA-binding NtrC family response regulator